MNATEKDTMSGRISSPETVDKVVSLYKFIKDLSALKQKLILNVRDYTWYQTIANIPNDPQNIEIFYRDRVEEESSELSTSLLCVHKPEYQRCPEPDPIFLDWLYEGWDQFNNEAAVREKIEHNVDGVQGTEKQETIISLFDKLENGTENTSDAGIEWFADDNSRVKAFEKWITLRNGWVQKQKGIERTRTLFTRLYQAHITV